MNIVRVINDAVEVKIELTPEEIYNAHTEYVTDFMKNVFIKDFNCSEDTAEELAELAYEKYCEGNGLTEYECIEKIYNESCL